MKNYNTSKKTKAVLAALLAALTVAACSNVDAATSTTNSEGGSSSEATEARNDLVIALQSEAPTLHPYDHKSVSSSYMNDMTFNSLFISDVITLDPVPSLVKEYEALSDTEWSFTLHQGVKFHDGTDLTTEDVLATMEYAREYPTTTDYTSFWETVEAVDDYTFTIDTGIPYAPTLHDLTEIHVLPSELIAADHDFNANPVGSGPYIFVSNTLSESVVFQANPDYFDTANAPSIENVTWKIIPEGSSRTIALETGEVDFIVDVESNDLARLDADEDVTVVRTDGTRHVALIMNTEVAPFNNEDFRKAVSAAVDRDSVVTVSLNGEGTASTAHATSSFAGHTTENGVTSDMEAAKQYLADSGVDTTGMTFEILVNNDADRRAAEVIQANLAELGITLEIVTTDYATYLSMIMGEGDFELTVVGYTSAHMSYFLKGFYHSDSIGSANIGRLNSPEIDALIEAADATVDPEVIKSTHEEVISKLNEMALNAPLYDTIMSRAFNSDLEGVVLSPGGKVYFNEVSWKN